MYCTEITRLALGQMFQNSGDVIIPTVEILIIEDKKVLKNPYYMVNMVFIDFVRGFIYSLLFEYFFNYLINIKI